MPLERCDFRNTDNQKSDNDKLGVSNAEGRAANAPRGKWPPGRAGHCALGRHRRTPRGSQAARSYYHPLLNCS